MYLNLAQIADSFGVTEKVIESWVRDEGLPHVRDGRRLLFERERVARWATTRGLTARVGFLAPSAAAVMGGWPLEPLLRAGGIWRDVPAAGLTEVFVRVATALPGATAAVRETLAERLRAHGAVAMAPLGEGCALPHPSARITLGRDSGAMALILLRDVLPLTEPRVDDVPVTRLVFLIAPSPRAHLDLIGRIGHLLVRGAWKEALARGATDDELFRAVAAVDALSAGGSEAKRT